MTAESSLAKLTAQGVIDNQINRHIVSETIFDVFSVVIRDRYTERLLVLFKAN